MSHDATNQIPEPLRSFADPGGTFAADLAGLDALHTTYAAALRAGRVLPNSLEAQRIELTYHSNAIEGSTLTLRETQMVVEGLTPPGGKPLREIYEARNHDRALRLIERWAEARPPRDSLSDRDILDIHAAVLTDIDASAAGRLRSGRVLIAGARYVPPGPQKFDVLLPAMLELANTPGLHVVLRAAELHYNIVAVHPFADGNGRTARLMMNYLLLRHGLPLTSIEIGERAEYLGALDEANEGRCGRFAGLVIRGVGRSLTRLLGTP